MHLQIPIGSNTQKNSDFSLKKQNKQTLNYFFNFVHWTLMWSKKWIVALTALWSKDEKLQQTYNILSVCSVLCNCICFKRGVVFTLVIICACLHILCSGSHRHEITATGCWCHFVWALWSILSCHFFLNFKEVQKCMTVSVIYSCVPFMLLKCFCLFFNQPYFYIFF